MFSLPSDLDQLCFKLFSQCDEFENTRTLRAVFTTTELAPFADGLPERTGNKTAFVKAVKLFLLEKRLADGRALMLPFLEALGESCLEAEALHGELHDLYQRVLAHTQTVAQQTAAQPAKPSPPSLPPPLSLNHHYLCYTSRDGREYAERLHATLRQAGAHPWLDRRDTPAAREALSAALQAADALLVHTPENYDALDARSLALTGLGGIEDARAINSDPGIVQRAARLLNQLPGVPRFWD